MFYPADLVKRLRANSTEQGWARKIAATIIDRAQPWVEMCDDDLWSQMFGATLPRSWMVWSNGHCPACKEPVPMYNWEIDALERPWKTRCSHCKEMFPKNDFYAFYRSGLDGLGIFNPDLADRLLLFNAEHPDPADPLHGFGVDDGTGYVEGDNRWRFIGAYLIYGQWKQAVLGGIGALAQAYLVTGETIYAHKTGILLDRVADVYPTFDFATQGYNYETQGTHGYLGNWHDACEETRELALAYDMVFEGIKNDAELTAFLSGKARQYGLANPKGSFAAIQRNIETGIFEDALANPHKIHSNYPRQDIALLVIRAVLNQPREQWYPLLDAMLEKATAVDGVTGEKGLAGYSSYTIQSLAIFLAQWERADSGFLARCLEVHPALRQTYRFHIDTWCMQQYYPQVGDTGWFGKKVFEYQGLGLLRPNRESSYSHQYGRLSPSMYSFLWQLYQLTNDPAYVQVMYQDNDATIEGLPYDLFAEDASYMQREIADVIAQHGAIPVVASVNKPQWHLGILRSGKDDAARAVWLHYQAGGGHGHRDAMNLGLFAYGLDLMPDFGYPPVQYGGWRSPRALWYTMSAAHNTVVVDGKNHELCNGETTVWADGEHCRAIRASAPEAIALTEGSSQVRQFERTMVQVDMAEADAFYVVDIFRVAGGQDHTLFMHSHFGHVQASGLSLTAGDDYGHDTQMRDVRWDAASQPGWHVDWRIEDYYGYLEPGKEIHFRYTSLTTEAQVALAEAWISYGHYNEQNEAWIPRLLVRRQTTEAVLASTFVGVIEPYDKASSIERIRRLPLICEDGQAYPDSAAAVEINHRDGTQDLLIAADEENPQNLQPSFEFQGVLIQPDWNVRLEGELCLVRKNKDGKLLYVWAAKTRTVRIDDQPFDNGDPARCFEWKGR